MLRTIVSMPDARLLLVPVVLLVQTVIVHWAATTERPPAPPALALFPTQFGEWRMAGEDPITPEVASVLHADQLLSRTYVQQPTNATAGLFVAWFQSQRGGASQPHSPKVCLPGSGWTPQVTGEIRIDTSAGAIEVNRYVVVNGKQRAVILYWFQTPRRVVAGEWAAKFWLVADAVRDHRTDAALVRITVWSSGGQDEAATAIGIGFVRGVYPLLRETLPR
jgi:EpsI family protein